MAERMALCFVRDRELERMERTPMAEQRLEGRTELRRKHGIESFGILSCPQEIHMLVIQVKHLNSWPEVTPETTAQSTRPGDSWADIVFNVLLSRPFPSTERVQGSRPRLSNLQGTVSHLLLEAMHLLLVASCYY